MDRVIFERVMKERGVEFFFVGDVAGTDFDLTDFGIPFTVRGRGQKYVLIKSRGGSNNNDVRAEFGLNETNIGDALSVVTEYPMLHKDVTGNCSRFALVPTQGCTIGVSHQWNVLLVAESYTVSFGPVTDHDRNYEWLLYWY